MSLNDEYAVARLNVFAKEQVPSIDVVYDMVTLKETQMKTKRGHPTESSAMYGNAENSQNNYARGGYNNTRRGGNMRSNDDIKKVMCSYCGMT